ncbi:MAG: helix-turn-helix domain-containing protein [Steroidobacteraceae bacterium]
MDISVSASIRKLVEGRPRDGSLGTLEHLATVARYEAGESVYRSSDAIDHWYRIIRGAARKSALSRDGRRYIVDFIFPGDLFGFRATGARHFCVETLVPGTLIARYPRRGVERLADYHPEIAHCIREAAFESIARLQSHMISLGRTSALERVCAFLLEVADRSHTAPTHAVSLPMSRYDIADYLGLAVETVSRCLTELRGRRAIAFRSVRQVRIRDRSALEEVADSLTEQPAHRCGEAPWSSPTMPALIKTTNIKVTPIAIRP